MSLAALKYHPDRNPGKELEFNSKFQAIQAAHEVLTDSSQRAKYDADRIRNGTLHTYGSSSVRPNPPPRSAPSNFPPPPRRTPQAPFRNNGGPQPTTGSNRYSSYVGPDATNTSKSPADEAKARANAFKAWEQMRNSQAVPPQARPVPPRPTKTGAFQPGRESGSYPAQEPSPRTTWDQTKEPHPNIPKTARSNTARVPKKSGFAPSLSAGDEPPARNTSAYFNVSKGERSDTSRHPPPSQPPPASMNHRTTPQRPDPLKSWRPQQGAEDAFTSKERISTPYATTGGEKTYFGGTPFSRPTSASRERPTSGEFHDSEPMERKASHQKTGSVTTQRGHQSASPHLRSSRPISVSSVSSSSSDESLREGVEQLYTSAGMARRAQTHNVNGHLKPTYKPYTGGEGTGEGAGTGTRSRSDAADKQARFAQQPQSAGPSIDPSLTEGFMEHRMKHEAGRSHFNHDAAPSPSRPSNPDRSHQRPLHRPKSWHEKYGADAPNQGNANINRPATRVESVKSSMYDAHGFDPSFFPSSSPLWYQQWPFGGPKPLATAPSVKRSLPNWAIPSCIPPSRRNTTQGWPGVELQPFAAQPRLQKQDADITLQHSFTFPNDSNGQKAHPPPLRSHSSDTISVNFSPSDWHGKFTGRSQEYFGSSPRRTPVTRGRASPTKRSTTQPSSAHTAPSTERSEVPNGNPHMPPPPPRTDHNNEYSPDKWAQYFRPGSLNWQPPPPPPAGPTTRGVSKKRAKTPSRRGSKTIFKRAAVPKQPTVTPVVDDEADDIASSNVESASSNASGNGSAMDLDSSSPPSAEKQRPANFTDANASTPRPPIPRRPVAPSQAQSIQQDGQLNLGDLKNVAPFAPNQQGIKDLNDLNTTLPFDSKASAKPADSPLSPRKLDIPHPPKPPIAPETLTQNTWDRYLAATLIYMSDWNIYNTKMLAHFNERQTSVDQTLKPQWLSAVGEGTEKWGFGKYMQGLEEDFRVREHWDVSWERHRECMRAFGAVRGNLIGSSVRMSP